MNNAEWTLAQAFLSSPYTSEASSSDYIDSDYGSYYPLFYEGLYLSSFYDDYTEAAIEVLYEREYDYLESNRERGITHSAPHEGIVSFLFFNRICLFAF